MGSNAIIETQAKMILGHALRSLYLSIQINHQKRRPTSCLPCSSCLKIKIQAEHSRFRCRTTQSQPLKVLLNVLSRLIKQCSCLTKCVLNRALKEGIETMGGSVKHTNPSRLNRVGKNFFTVPGPYCEASSRRSIAGPLRKSTKLRSRPVLIERVCQWIIYCDSIKIALFEHRKSFGASVVIHS
ncbi:hypothetical protein K438DRAFT_1947066, partial [Mycena galopus ATCC 62051]